MYILQNAFRNILRNRGRNMLIGAIVFVIIIASVVALMINNTADGVIDDYKDRFAAEVSLVPDMQKLREQLMEESTDGSVRMTRPIIPAEQYIVFGESDYLQGSIYTAAVGVNNDDLTAVDGHLGGGTNRRGGSMGGGGSFQPTLFLMKLLGNEFDDFTDGLREIAEGRMPENENEAIVSTDLAELNELSIGDTLTFESELLDDEGEPHEIEYTITIVGTYYDATDEYAEGIQQNAFTNRRNEILTGYDTVVSAFIPDHSGIDINATYFLENPDYLEAFAEEVYGKGLDSIFDVTTDEASYNKIVGPVEGLKSISLTFMIIVLIFGGTIIALLSSIAIRERKYEIGVLRAMGMKKQQVAFGLWSEMLLITCFCLVVGIGAGMMVAQPVTDMLLEHQIEAAEASVSQTSGPMIMGMGAVPANSDAEPLENIDISLGLITILQIIGIALVLASLAGIVSISKITKYEPIKILMERN
ncbi:putative ABC transport system permease protein [Evansella caseinilytica]|uniref:Putative ABC transport system permease protein n=1 Tax=Evansella caseinilytica TaxID=1503961 RepID=A0A1H3Q5A3_9BACI|nr:ABC transporter permease [Evansella caseinilytica]SDZ08288.1 putative ABC transport system permease protein [Evansella caseinilytica]